MSALLPAALWYQILLCFGAGETFLVGAWAGCMFTLCDSHCISTHLSLVLTPELGTGLLPYIRVSIFWGGGERIYKRECRK